MAAPRTSTLPIYKISKCRIRARCFVFGFHLSLVRRFAVVSERAERVEAYAHALAPGATVSSPGSGTGSGWTHCLQD